MLNETLNKVQSSAVEIRALKAQVVDPALARKASANLNAAELARQRFQRMRRRHQRAQLSNSVPAGWVARIA